MFGGNKLETVGKPTRVVPWIEKYRPNNLDDIVFQDHVVTILKQYVKTGDFPNSLFYGPPGTGKTSAILALAKEIFGYANFQDRILELNASDERGISVIRDKVKKFAKISISLGAKHDGRVLPPFKIIILDEADSMTSAAQAALRRIMEKEIKTTRFCIICNYITRIIDPITSRCTKFRFKPVPYDCMLVPLKNIASKENVLVNDDILLKLLEFSSGDLRKAILFLHSSCLYSGARNTITNEVVSEVCGIIPDTVFSNLVSILKTDSLDQVLEFCSEFIASGYSITQLFPTLLSYFIHTIDLIDDKKANILEAISECEAAINNGADEYLQLISMCSTMLTNYSG